MLQIPKTAPRTPDEYEYLIHATVANSQEEYENAVEAAKEKALAQWEAIAAARPMTLAEDEDSAELAEKLEREKVAAIQKAVASVPQPLTREQVENTYGMYKPQEQEPAPVPVIDEKVSAPPVYEAIYKVGDNYWNVAEARWVAEPTDTSKMIVLGGEPTVENLRENLLHYGTMDPRIKLGPEIMTEVELFARLREERDKRLEEYDRKVAQLDRLVRLSSPQSESIAYTEQRQAWDEYAQQLCALPDEEGAPWDGGGENTPWPVKPE